MTAKDVIQRTLGMSESITKAYLADLTAADLLIRPVPGQNHIAWQLGHLLLSEQYFLDGIKPGSSPKLPPGFEVGHGRESTKLDDPSKYHSPEEYLNLRTAQREATRKVLAELDETAIDAPSPEGLQKAAPTVGGIFLLIGNHDLMHVGQFVSVRRKLDKPIAM
jgi:hypothetical protein